MKQNASGNDLSADQVLNETENEKEEGMGDLVKAMLIAGVFALAIRTFAFEPFNIPSGSMLPTLQIGDYLFVSKYSYGYGQYSFPFGLAHFDGRLLEKEPTRGDVAVFRKPTDPSIDYIKRIIGLPGDTIQVRGGLLYINDEVVPRILDGVDNLKDDDGYFMLYNRYIETLPNGVKHYIYELSDMEERDNTPEYIVPEGYYFVMGDNRDRSQDSRVQSQVGFVPADNLIGRAEFIFFSIEDMGDHCDKTGFLHHARRGLCKVIAWPQHIRFGRMFRGIDGL